MSRLAHPMPELEFATAEAGWEAARKCFGVFAVGKRAALARRRELGLVLLRLRPLVKPWTWTHECQSNGIHVRTAHRAMLDACEHLGFTPQQYAELGLRPRTRVEQAHAQADAETRTEPPGPDLVSAVGRVNPNGGAGGLRLVGGRDGDESLAARGLAIPADVEPVSPDAAEDEDEVLDEEGDAPELEQVLEQRRGGAEEKRGQASSSTASLSAGSAFVSAPSACGSAPGLAPKARRPDVAGQISLAPLFAAAERRVAALLARVRAVAAGVRGGVLGAGAVAALLEAVGAGIEAIERDLCGGVNGSGGGAGGGGGGELAETSGLKLGGTGSPLSSACPVAEAPGHVSPVVPGA